MNTLGDINPKTVTSYTAIMNKWKHSKPGNYRARLHASMKAIRNDIWETGVARGADPETIRSVLAELERHAHDDAS